MKALAEIAPYEKLLTNGRPVDVKTDNSSLFFSGYRHGSEMLILVGNYENCSRTRAAITLPFKRVAKVREIRQGESLPARNPLLEPLAKPSPPPLGRKPDPSKPW